MKKWHRFLPVSVLWKGAVEAAGHRYRDASCLYTLSIQDSTGGNLSADRRAHAQRYFCDMAWVQLWLIHLQAQSCIQKKKKKKPASSCDYCGKTWAHIYFSFSPQKPFTFEVCREFPRWKSLHTGLILLVLLQFIPLFVILSLRVFRSLSLSLASFPSREFPPSFCPNL